MRLAIIIPSLIIGSFLMLSNNYLPSVSKKVISCDSTPVLNKQIIAFVKTKIGKKVGKGECWDVAAEALNSTGAKWDGSYVFGKEVNYKKDCVFPGDIMQFEGITLKYDMDGKHYMEKMAHHTAIVYEVKGREEFVLADQNTGRSGKKVGLSPFNFVDITKGKFKIFRPVNN
ncbi:MAG: hypothetical protein ABIP51_21365 [Bacteroidia bacterium]